MAQYHYPSRYWADDKDVHDLLSQAKFSHRKLLQIAAKRGIFLSKKLPKETIVSYLSILPFQRVELIAFLEEIETENKDPSLTNQDLDLDLDLQQIENAVNEVKEIRGSTKSEVYSLRTSGNTVYVTVLYQDVNPASTRMLQWTDHRLEIQINKKDSKIQIRYGATEKGTEIAESLIKAFQPKEGPSAIVNSISLQHITNHEKRTEFFRKIIYGIEGLRPENVMDIRLNKLRVDGSDNASLETEEMSLDDISSSGNTDDEIENAPAASVKKSMLSGDSLLQSTEFRDFIKKGFFISKAVWTAIEIEGAGRKFEFEAEFKEPETASRFIYKPKGFWDRDDDGQLLLRKTDPKLDDRRILIEKMETAAQNALSDLNKSIEVEAASDSSETKG